MTAPHRPLVSLVSLALAFVIGWCVAPVATGQCAPSAFSPMDPGSGGPNDYAAALIGWDPDGAGPLPESLIERLEVEKGFIPPDRPPLLPAPSSVKQEGPR